MKKNDEILDAALSSIIHNKTSYELVYDAWREFMSKYISLKTISRKKDVLNQLSQRYNSNVYEIVFASHLLVYIIAREFALGTYTDSELKELLGENLFEDAISNINQNEYNHIRNFVVSNYKVKNNENYYDFLERTYRSVLPSEIRKSLGEYFTPFAVAHNMVSKLDKNQHERCSGLWSDNAAGFGVFLLAFCDYYSPDKVSDFYSFEVNPLSVLIIKMIFIELFGIEYAKRLNVIWGDFLLGEQYCYRNRKIIQIDDFSKFQNLFSVVIGNPPWVAWKSLSDSYQKMIGDDWRSYDLFNTKITRSSYGACNDDISSYYIYKTIDFLIRDRGILNYLVNLTLFRSESSGEEFRKYFIRKSNTPFKIEEIIDYNGCKIFPGVTNTYCAFVAVKGQTNTYPIKYLIVRDNKETYAYKTNERNSALEIKQDINGRNVDGKNFYKARAGVCTWLNGVYWVDKIDNESAGSVSDNTSKIRNLGKCGKKKLKIIDSEIENDLLYNCLRARNLKDFSPVLENYIIVPQLREDFSKPIDEDHFSKNYPLAMNYFSLFKDDLLARSGYGKFLVGKPFFSLYNIGDYTRAPIKICWQFISKKFRVFIIDHAEKIIPDLNVMFIPLSDYDEAFYLYALLNSHDVAAKIESSSNWTFPAGSIKKIKIDKYDAANTIHSNISKIQKEIFDSQNEADALHLYKKMDKILDEYW